MGGRYKCLIVFTIYNINSVSIFCLNSLILSKDSCIKDSNQQDQTECK